MVQEGSRRFKKVKEGSKRYNRIHKDSTASWGWAVPSLGQIKAWYNVYWAQSARISPTMRHGKMFLRNEGENKSVLTPIWEGRILPPELKLCGEGSAFFQNKIHESYYDKEIHGQKYQSFFVQTNLYHAGFYSLLSDKKQRNCSIFRIKMKILEFYDNHGQKLHIM